MLKRIAIITRFPPHLGGAEIVAVNLAHRLSSRYQISVITPDAGYWAPNFRIQVFQNLREMRDLLQKFKPDIVNVHAPYFVEPAYRFTSAARIPLLATLHGFFYCGFSENYKRLADRIGNLNIYYSSVCLTQRTDYLSHWSCGAERFFVTPNGVCDSTLVEYNNRMLRGLRGIFNLPERVRIILMSARLTPLKGIDLVIRALDRLPSNVYLLVSTPTDRLDAAALKYLLKLQRLAKKMKLLHRLIVQFHDPESARLIHGVADLLVVGSKTEASPLSILEAMSDGLPVIAPLVGGVPEIIRDRCSGLLYEAGSVAQLRKLILEALSWSPSMRRKVIRNARMAVEKKYTIDEMVKKYENIYAKCLKEYEGT